MIWKFYWIEPPQAANDKSGKPGVVSKHGLPGGLTRVHEHGGDDEDLRAENQIPHERALAPRGTPLVAALETGLGAPAFLLGLVVVHEIEENEARGEDGHAGRILLVGEYVVHSQEHALPPQSG